VRIIRLQKFPHWIFVFHGRFLTSSANLRVTITSVRSQPCFNVVQKGVGMLFPTHYTSEKAQQLDQVCRSRWRLQVKAHPKPEPIWPIVSKWVPHPQRTSCRQSQHFKPFIHSKRISLNHYGNVKWTMKRPLHHWHHIMKLIF